VTAADKFIDLDAVLAEQADAATPLVARLYGKDWDLPGTLPAAVTMRMLLWVERGWINEAGEVSPDVGALDQMALLADIVPTETMSAWCAKGLDTSQVEPVMGVIMACYEKQMEARALGEAAAAQAKGRSTARSSKAGRSSKPTSTASTASRTSQAS